MNDPNSSADFFVSRYQVPSMKNGIVRPPISLPEVEENECTAFFSSFIDIRGGNATILSTTTNTDLEAIASNSLPNLVNLHRINDIRRINRFFEIVNNKLSPNGVFIGCVETVEQKKKKLLMRFPKAIALALYFMDFLFRRLCARCKHSRKLYFLVTKGRNRDLSLTETLGRLYSCGFTVMDHRKIGGLFYFVAQKKKDPAYDMTPSYGAICTLKRIGKNGKIIQVYKLRTMHPYAEYLQEYVFARNDLNDNGKFKDDFRITRWGKICRRHWIDELPMFLNLLKREMKLVGVRPLSRHYFDLYPKELRDTRTRYLPGLIPPFYLDLPKTFEEILESERRYLEAYERHPILTDTRYLILSIYNIVFKRARSG